jgi:hypothetical protein
MGMGLAAIAYSFVFSSSPHTELEAQKTPLFIASALGAASVLADILQSFAERKSAQETLDFLKSCRMPEYIPTPREIESKRRSSGGDSAFALLVIRFVMCIFGTGFLMFAIGRTL